jgi:hypothetical protein
MNKEILKKVIREEIKKALQPATKPREKEVLPGSPPDEKKRRTLRPTDPNILPQKRPKAMYEGENEDIINKIVQRFKQVK